MGEISNEEMVNIANGFLLAAPPGEFMEVVTDVRALLPNESMLNSTAHATFREYNTEQMIQVNSPGNKHQVVITKHGEVGDNAYLDPRGKQVLIFDHIKQEVSSTRPIGAELDADLEPVRAAFEQEAQRYVDEHYSPNGAVTVYARKEGGQNQITIAIASSKFNPHNYWNGRWRSLWTVAFKAGGQANLQGSLKVNVHYYEDGNVQLNTQTTKNATVPVTADPAAFAREVLKTISKVESTFHQSLETSYNTMGETTFKALRRALPITKSRIVWSRIRTYRLGQEIGK